MHMIRFPFYLCNFSIQICLFSVALVICKISTMIRYKFKLLCGRILFTTVLFICFNVTQQTRRKCTSSSKCYLNQGYCSGYDSRCYGNLACGYNNCPSYGYYYYDDCCECNCNDQGHTGDCDTDGNCYCKSGYYGFPNCKGTFIESNPYWMRMFEP